MATTSSPTVPDAPETNKVSFSSENVPVKAVTVFTENRAEITRLVNFPSPSIIGLHEVELTELPGSLLIDEESVRVKGSGHCTILHVSYDQEADETPELTEEEKEAAKATEQKLKKDIEMLSNEHAVLAQQSARNRRMRELADRFADRVVTATAGGSATAAAALSVSDTPAPSVDDVGKALDWWAETAFKTDAEVHRLELEEKRLKEAIAQLRGAPASIVTKKQNKPSKPRGRVLVSLDVQELGPVELEVKYMIRGATWAPAYDLRVDTQTDSISCSYFGRVTQNTTEDWEGVALRLSTAEPTVRGTPPALENKIVSLKTKARKKSFRRSGSSVDCLEEEEDLDGGDCSFEDEISMVGGYGGGGRGGGGRGGRTRGPGCAASAPPPPPRARPAVAQVEGGGGIGAVSFVVAQPATIKSNGQTKKLTVGVLQLSAEVAHYVVPSKEPAAYLQAKATNNTDYLLLASKDVSIFFDNSFVTKTSLASVSPGESFQTFLGIDPAVKITLAPPRKSSKKRGIFAKSNHVTHMHSTSISNKKKVPVTCVVVDAMPRSTDEIIKVTLKQPPPMSVSDSDAITDDALVAGALEKFGGAGGDSGGRDDDGRSNSSTSNQPPPLSSTPMISGVTGVAKSPSNHLAWVGKIAPQGELRIPLEYAVEWPTGKEIQISEKL